MTVPSKGSAGNTGKTTTTRLTPFFSFLITFVLMFLTWIVLSGKFEPLLIGLGLVSSFFVSYYFYNMLFPSLKINYFIIFFRFTKYIPWIIWEIIKSNFHLLYLAFHPRLKEKLDPQIITFRTNLKSDIAIATLANSITLTPGTITISANSDGVFKVHAIDLKSAQGLQGPMIEKVAHIFGEEI